MFIEVIEFVNDGIANQGRIKYFAGVFINTLGFELARIVSYWNTSAFATLEVRTELLLVFGITADDFVTALMDDRCSSISSRPVLSTSCWGDIPRIIALTGGIG